jgi:hypothetical protein
MLSDSGEKGKRGSDDDRERFKETEGKLAKADSETTSRNAAGLSILMRKSLDSEDAQPAVLVADLAGFQVGWRCIRGLRLLDALEHREHDT